MTDWTDIHEDFTDELQKEWEKLGFDSSQVQKWIENVCLEPTDAEFAFFLKNCEYNVEDIEEWDNDFVNSMRDQYNEAKIEKIDPSRKRKSTTDEDSIGKRRSVISQEWVDCDFTYYEEYADWINIYPHAQQEIVEKSTYDKSNWFSPQRWLTDQEIDWASQQLEKNDKHKLLPAHRFHYVREAGNTAEAQAYMAFPNLLAELNEDKHKVVFIPVNQSEFHWSLLVYKTKSKTFYHYDTLNGANYEYLKPLVKDILLAKEVPESEWEQHLIAKHDFYQGNDYDCGVAVIAFVRKIIENYLQDNSSVELNLNNFSLTNERKLWREKWEKNQLISQIQIPQKD